MHYVKYDTYLLTYLLLVSGTRQHRADTVGGGLSVSCLMSMRTTERSEWHRLNRIFGRYAAYS